MKTASLTAVYLEDNLFTEKIRIETIIRKGLPIFRIAGFHSRSRDREERIRTAILACGIQFPYSTVIVNLSPADRIKDSALFDLAIAVCVLKAIGSTDIRRFAADDVLFLGELSLTGQVRPLPELSSWALSGLDVGFQKVVIPKEAAQNMPAIAANTNSSPWLGIEHLSDIFEDRAKPVTGCTFKPNESHVSSITLPEKVIRLLTIAAAGKHGLLLIGPPGAGKSMAAKLLYELLPSPTIQEQHRIIRNALLFRDPTDALAVRPLRQPHHSITVTGMVGGGVPLRAGEANRASDGVLLLDELAEYDRQVVEALREPLELHEVIHNRNGRPGRLPARFWLVATSNPCPCGYFRSHKRACRCSRLHIDRRRHILAGPFADRIDLQFHYDKEPDSVTLSIEELTSKIERAAMIQLSRNNDLYNGELTGSLIESYGQLADEAAKQMWQKIKQNAMTRRKAIGIRRLARTIADLDEAFFIRAEDLKEAQSYTIPEDFWEDALPPKSNPKGNTRQSTAVTSQENVKAP